MYVYDRSNWLNQCGSRRTFLYSCRCIDEWSLNMMLCTRVIAGIGVRLYIVELAVAENKVENRNTY